MALHGEPEGEFQAAGPSLFTPSVQRQLQEVPQIEDPQYQPLATHQPLINLGILIVEQTSESSELAETTTDGSESMSDRSYALDTWNHEIEHDTVLEDVCSDDCSWWHDDSDDDDFQCFDGNAERCFVCKAKAYGIPDKVRERLDDYEFYTEDPDTNEIINVFNCMCYCYRCHIAYPEHIADAVAETLEAYDDTFGRSLRLRREFCVRLEIRYVPAQHHEFDWWHLSEDGTSLGIIRGVYIERRTRLPTHAPRSASSPRQLERIRHNWEEDARELLR